MVPVVYPKLRLWSKVTFISTSGPKGLKSCDFSPKHFEHFEYDEITLHILFFHFFN